MIEKVVLDYLDRSLDVAAFMEVPEDPPAEYLVIEKVGSGEKDQIGQATIAVKSHAKSLYRAAQINELVKSAMKTIAVSEEVFSAKLNSDYNFTDPSTKQYRYQAVYDIFY